MKTEKTKQPKAKKELTKKSRIIILVSTIVGGLAIGCGSGFLIGYFGKPVTINMDNIDVADVADDNSDLLTKYENVKSEGKDPIVEFPVDQLANIALLKFGSLEHSYSFGYGYADTAFRLDVRNATVVNGDSAMEESISLSESGAIVRVAVSQRAYQTSNVSYYGADLPDVEHPSWIDNKTEMTIDEYSDKFGKTVNSTFSYIISSKTVLTDKVTETKSNGQVVTGNSKATKSDSGYTINLDLHSVYSIVKYRKRMMALSGSEIKYFDYVRIRLDVDDDFNLVSSTVNESYFAGLGGISAQSVGELTTYYFAGEKAIPDLTTGIDYSLGRPL